MIGDKWHAEAAGSGAVRRTGSVGERNRDGEDCLKELLELRLVRMQTRVAINRVRIPVAVNPRFPGPGSSSQG